MSKKSVMAIISILAIVIILQSYLLLQPKEGKTDQRIKDEIGDKILMTFKILVFKDNRMNLDINDKRIKLDGDIERLKSVKDTNNADEIKSAIEGLTRASHKLAETMYKNSSQDNKKQNEGVSESYTKQKEEDGEPSKSWKNEDEDMKEEG